MIQRTWNYVNKFILTQKENGTKNGNFFFFILTVALFNGKRIEIQI